MEADITELLEDVGQWFVIGAIDQEELQWEFIFYHEKQN